MEIYMKQYIKAVFCISMFGALVGCTTFEDIDKGLSNLYGQNINSLIAKIGYPNKQNEVAGRKLYIWDSSQTVSYFMPTTSYSSGSVNSYGTYGSAYGTYSGTTTSYVPQVATYFCTITVEVDSSETIVAAQYGGNIGGCERYAAAFRK
jgi:hypothetical protein